MEKNESNSVNYDAKVCFLTASKLFYEEYRRLEEQPWVDKAYFIQKSFKTEEMVNQIKAIIFS